MGLITPQDRERQSQVFAEEVVPAVREALAGAAGLSGDDGPG